MASLSVSVKHTLPSLLQYAQTPKKPISQNLTIVSRSSQSHFYGLEVLHSPSFSTPSSSRTSIVAKVNCIAFVLHLPFFMRIKFCFDICRWIKVQRLHHSHWKIKMEKMWVSPSLKESLWWFISTLLMKLLVAPNRYR